MAKREMDVEALLVWAYRVERADQKAGRPMAMRPGRGTVVRSGADFTMGYGPDSCIRVARAAMAGPAGKAVETCHPDAEAVHAAVRRLSTAQARMLIHYAKKAGRPDWLEGAKLVWVPVMTKRGKGRKVMDDATGGIASWTTLAGTPKPVLDGHRHVIGHFVVPGVELAGGVVMAGWWSEQVEQRRSEYKVWHGALVDLAAYLAGGCLEAHDVTGPAAADRPWEKVSTTFAQNAA